VKEPLSSVADYEVTHKKAEAKIKSIIEEMQLK
jgi:hypothetical protein